MDRGKSCAQSLAQYEEGEHDQNREYESRRWSEGVHGASHHLGDFNAATGKNPHANPPPKWGKRD